MARNSDPLVDPRLVTLETRLRGVRVALDRLDDTVDLLDRDSRVTFARCTTRLRGELDGLEEAVTQHAAGLQRGST
jgi:hypothetical protein